MANFMIQEMMEGASNLVKQKEMNDDRMLEEIEHEMERRAIANSMLDQHIQEVAFQHREDSGYLRASHASEMEEEKRP